jgi:molybdopterin-guanine dinucleotide biosynthesis protein B
MCVIGRGRSKGKTWLIEKLIETFMGEGLRVATVKHIHGTFDTAKKDTWRHLEAGATVTIASTPTEVVAIRRSTAPSLGEALEAIYVEADLVLVEGYKMSPHPKILCAETASDARVAINDVHNIVMVSGSIARNLEERKRLQAAFPEIGVYSLEELVPVIKEMLVKEILQSLPGLNCGHCGHDTCLGLAKVIVTGEATKEDCEVLSTNVATLKVDGIVTPLGKFPQEVLRGVTLGVLTSLKGVSKHLKNIEVTIKTD